MQFPVLLSYTERRENPDLIKSVPWAMLAPYEDQAQSNHGQTLQRLAERGGLDPVEMIAIMDGKPLRWIREEIVNWKEHCKELERRVKEFEGPQPASELEFLRWFYANAPLVGMPESTRRELKEKFCAETKQKLPKDY